MKLSQLIEKKAVLQGATTAFLTSAMGLGLAMLAKALFSWSKSGTSNLASLFVLFGSMLGGFRAGLGAPRAPLSNGAAAALLAGVVASVVQRLVMGKGFNPINTMFVALICGSLGIFGGLVANNANRMRNTKTARGE